MGSIWKRAPRVAALASEAEHRLPRVGEKWVYVSDEFSRPLDESAYWVTFVDDRVIHLQKVSTGADYPEYPILTWMNASDKWKYVERADEYFCGRCEENPRAENDYLCEECRYGSEESI